MITITLPDGTKKEFEKGVTGIQIAESIGAGLAKAALAIKVNGQLRDMYLPVNEDADIAILTWKDAEGKAVFWHSTAHILAHAITDLFPDAHRVTGPAIEEGFYHDFDRETPFSEEDLVKIEKRMQELIDENFEVKREECSAEEAKKHFLHNPYKLELVEEFEDPVSIYYEKEKVDLCRGPHIPKTGMVKGFKLLKVSGAYWKGDANNKQLQRIYGISFPDKKELKQYLHNLEEAKKRDHRVIGQKLDLFSFDDITPGSPFFHPKGACIYNELLVFMREQYRKRGYNEVVTPLIYDKTLWETSGHWEHYHDDMFEVEMDGKPAALKPMNCPSHCVIYSKGFKSYRDLPLRIADFAPLHRNELKGTLGGLTRVRKFSQDDAHLFVTPDQLQDEIADLIDFLDYIYKEVFGFEYRLELSTKPEKSMGSEQQWTQAEAELENAMKKKNLQYNINPGDGAFYGPKIDFHIKDVLGRSWQLGTIQVDFNLPERFNLEYEDKDGSRKQPIMIHRALLGSIERFMAILIEHYGGKFPLWLAPEQVRILSVSDKSNEYAQNVLKELKDVGIRAEIDVRTESIPKKVREAQLAYVPLAVTIGEKEQENKTLAVRTLDGKVKFDVPVNNLIATINKTIAEKSQTIEL